jgi:hypothetical protein
VLVYWLESALAHCRSFRWARTAMDSERSGEETPGLTVLDFHLRLPSAAASLTTSKHPCAVCGKRMHHYCTTDFVPTIGVVTLEPVELPLHCHVLRGWDERAEKSSAASLLSLCPLRSSLSYVGTPRSKLLEATQTGPKPSTEATALALPSTEIHAALSIVEDGSTRGSATSESEVVRPKVEQFTSWPSIFPHPERVLLLFPSPSSKSAVQLGDLDAFDAIIALDTTWQKTGSVMAATGMLDMPFQHVHIADYNTLFWRHQPLGPHCTSTAEAVYLFCREFAVEKERRRLLASLGPARSMILERVPWEVIQGKQWASGDAVIRRELTEPDLKLIPAYDPENILYDGKFDGMLMFFLANYARVQFEYTKGLAAKQGKTFHHRMRTGYIKYTDSVTASEDAQHVSDTATETPEAIDLPAKRTRTPLPPPETQRRPKRLRGGWAVRTDILDATAASRVQMARHGVGAEVAVDSDEAAFRSQALHVSKVHGTCLDRPTAPPPSGGDGCPVLDADDAPPIP